ncbi:hypothetical protein ALC60_05716, partial [Trachymyrmex zeteki]
IRVLLTIPTSTCSNERSFSYLRHLKSYLRSKQKRLNHIATLYIHISRSGRSVKYGEAR